MVQHHEKFQQAIAFIWNSVTVFYLFFVVPERLYGFMAHLDWETFHHNCRTQKIAYYDVSLINFKFTSGEKYRFYRKRLSWHYILT